MTTLFRSHSVVIPSVSCFEFHVTGWTPSVSPSLRLSVVILLSFDSFICVYQRNLREIIIGFEFRVSRYRLDSLCLSVTSSLRR